MVDKNFEEFESFGEENEDDINIGDHKSFSEAVIWGTDWTVETILSQLVKGNIDLKPKFQRRDAWNQVEKSRLIESLMLGVPVPPIILAEKKDNRGKYIVIDGKQRLLAIRQFCAGESDDFAGLKLKQLQILQELNGKTIQEIQDDYRLGDFKNQLENQTIRTVVIKNWPSEAFLFAVFLRLNTGSKKLSPQELRQALHPGEFLDFLDDATAESESFLKLLNNTEADSRMRDVELALRFYAFKYNIENNRGNLKELLDATCERLNNAWSTQEKQLVLDFKNLEKAIEFCFTLFGEKSAFSRYTSKGYNNRFNRPLFEVFTYYFAKEEILSAINNNKEEFTSEFESLSLSDHRFNESISSTTKELTKVEYRFNKIQELIRKITSLPVPKLVKRDGYLEIVTEE